MYNIAGCIWWLHKTALFVQVSYSDTFLVICMTIKYVLYTEKGVKVASKVDFALGGTRYW